MKKQLPAWLALCIISLVAGLLLALTNHLTVDRIAEQGAAKANAARQSVMQGAESFTLLELNPEWLKDCGVDDCYECRDGEGALTGYTSQITVKGYGGAIEVVTGMDAAGAITGINVGGSGFAETAGLGAKVKDAAFTGQFAGKTVPLALQEDIDSITGASISSGAVVGGVNKAATYMMYQAGLAQPEENPLEGAFEVRTGEAQGFAGPVFLQVGVDESGAITGIQAGDERFAETSGLGDRVKEKAFRDQFLGKSGSLGYGEDIEAIAGATVTSNAFMAALNEALGTAAESAEKAAEETAAESAAEPVEEAAEEPAAEPEETAEVPVAEPLSASAQGFGGPVEVSITLNADGAIASLEVGGEGFAETPGLGTNVQEPAFTDQFIGKKGPFAFGEGVDAVTGATVTSNAVLDALNSLFAAEEVEDIAAEPVEEVAEEAAGEPEEASDAEPLSASSQGFGGPVEVTITLNADGAIASLEVGGEGFAETPGLGTNVQEPAFTDQFIGKKGPFAFGEGVDAVTGATVTSNAVLDALNSLFAAEEATDIAVEAVEEDAEEAAGEPEEASDAEPLSASSQGFGGPVEVTITLNADGTIASLEVGGEGFAETPGIGTNVQEPAFTDQFVGKKGPFAFGEGVDAVTGATLTSNAALTALNSLFAAEEAAKSPAAGSLSASSQGFGGPVEVAITLNEDGTIASLEVGGEGFAETPGIGTNVQEPAFTDQFIGKKGPFAFGEGVDAVAGATVSSNAALDALNSLFQ